MDGITDDYKALHIVDSHVMDTLPKNSLPPDSSPVVATSASTSVASGHPLEISIDPSQPYKDEAVLPRGIGEQFENVPAPPPHGCCSIS